jgi:hypothetical protein
MAVHLGCDPPHLWVTASQKNLVYSRYEGNKMAIITGRRLAIFVVAYCAENTIAANGYCIAGGGLFRK